MQAVPPSRERHPGVRRAIFHMAPFVNASGGFGLGFSGRGRENQGEDWEP